MVPQHRHHALGKNIMTFASQIDNWTSAHQKPTRSEPSQHRSHDNNDTTALPPAACTDFRLRSFLDNGEGKTRSVDCSDLTKLHNNNTGEVVPIKVKHRINEDTPQLVIVADSLAPPGAIQSPELPADTPRTAVLPNLKQVNANARRPQNPPPANLHAKLLQGDGATDGLRPPHLSGSTLPVTGCDKKPLRLDNKARRKLSQLSQKQTSLWSGFKGDFHIPPGTHSAATHRNNMCPTGLARAHPAGDLLYEWSQYGCPTMTGHPWTKAEMEAAITRGPHKSSLTTEAIAHFTSEVEEKIAAGQARIVRWEDIRHNPPPQLKISPIAAVPHKSKAFRSILDLSFSLRLTDATAIPSVNSTTTKLAPRAAVDQLGHSLTRLIHAFAEADPNEKIFMAKWDVKDGFWRLDCAEGEEYNFAYVLPQPPGSPVTLVIPTSLQMGWVESPAYFSTASETSRDVSTSYCQAPIGSLPGHKFGKYIEGREDFAILPMTSPTDDNMKFLLEVFVDDFMSLVIATSQQQLLHVGTATMRGIHDVFPHCTDDDNDPISVKKMKNGDARFLTRKTLLGFDFDGVEKTIWLEESKRDALLLILKGWIRSSARSHAGIPFKTFESVTAKMRHAFTALPSGLGLLSPCNKILALRPHTVFLHQNNDLRVTILEMRVLLRESIAAPTKCRELVSGWPHLIGYSDASGIGFGGVVIGELDAVPPTVFRGQWPPDITKDLVSVTNPNGRLSISDLEMAGLVLLWLVIEAVAPTMAEKNFAMFSDNSPSVSWIDRMASKKSAIGAHLLRALTLRLKMKHCCPITPLHVAGKHNMMADCASRSFGRPSNWHCKSDADFKLLFNHLFPLPLQNTWSVFRPSKEICMRVISVLRMTPSSLDEWHRIPRIGQHTGEIGAPTSHLWAWTRISNIPRIPSGSESSPASPHEHERVTLAAENKSKLERYLQLSRPLARRSLWNVRETQSN
jgi:hypothetical protein